MKQNEELETDLRNLKNERDSITASLQLALTKADSQQLLRKIAEDQVALFLPIFSVNLFASDGCLFWLSVCCRWPSFVVACLL